MKYIAKKFGGTKLWPTTVCMLIMTSQISVKFTLFGENLCDYKVQRIIGI
jgi:hypothetical protein